VAVELRIEGDAMKALQRKLKAVDRKDWRRELNKGLREGAAPLVQDARDAARDGLPSRGGLAERIASLPTTISVTQGGVRVRVKGTDANAADKGLIRHPVFARKGYAQRFWVMQKITDRMQREAPKVRPELVKAMDRIAEKIARA